MDTQRRVQSREPGPRAGRGWRKQRLPRAPMKGVNLHHDFGLRLLKMANVGLITIPH